MLRNIQDRLTQSQIIAIGFFILIVIGTFLLCLPCATKTGEETTVITALFTATSATCVTGLIAADTYQHWTYFGQIVIIVMIQIGGLGFMTMGVLFSMFLRKKISLKFRSVLQEAMNSQQIGGIVRLVKKISFGTLLIEGVGAILLMIRFIPMFGIKKGIYFGIFHSISAFCNAGFDLMGIEEEYSSFVNYSTDFIINITIMLLIIIGGIGFIVWDDVTKNKLNIKKYMLHTKIVLLTTFVLIFAGAALFYIFEYNNLNKDMSVYEKIMTSLFSSVTARTAGFNTVDLGALTNSSKLFMMLLMFIGGSPGSTAGGVKTVTVVVLLVYVWSNLRNSRGCNIFKRRIEDEAIKKASNVVVLNLLLVVVASIVISSFQEIPMDDLLFETFSAIGTVGMTTGITRNLCVASKIVIILLMYCGRIGSMSFALSFVDRKKVAPVQLPTEKIMIG